MKKELTTRKKEAEILIKKCARTYEEKLLNKNLMFLIRQANKKIQFLEVAFFKENFLHLTGLEVDKSKTSAKDFFNRCIHNKLSINDFEFRKDHTSDLKLKILPTLVNIDTTANMLGDFDNTKLLLKTKKIVGNISACMGFQYYENRKAYIPNTAIKEDIRKITTSRGRIICILKKNIQQDLYCDMTYIAKNVDIVEILKNEQLKNKIDFKNFEYVQKIFQKP